MKLPTHLQLKYICNICEKAKIHKDMYDGNVMIIVRNEIKQRLLK